MKTALPIYVGLRSGKAEYSRSFFLVVVVVLAVGFYLVVVLIVHGRVFYDGRYILGEVIDKYTHYAYKHIKFQDCN